MGKLVDAVGGFGWRQVAVLVGVPRRGMIQTLHASPGAVLVRASSQIAMVVAGEVTGGGTAEGIQREKGKTLLVLTCERERSGLAYIGTPGDMFSF